jgi:ribonuclease P protein component
MSGTRRPNGRLRACDRLRKRSDFTRVQDTGGRVVAPGFIFLMAPSPPGCGTPRLGITASRRVGNAVVRNRAKRVVREAFRATRSLWPTPFDLVVIVRHPLPPGSFAQVLDQWRDAAPRIAARSCAGDRSRAGARSQDGGSKGARAGKGARSGRRTGREA